jgi:hypothetical protein
LTRLYGKGGIAVLVIISGNRIETNNLALAGTTGGNGKPLTPDEAGTDTSLSYWEAQDIYSTAVRAISRCGIAEVPLPNGRYFFIFDPERNDIPVIPAENSGIGRKLGPHAAQTLAAYISLPCGPKRPQKQPKSAEVQVNSESSPISPRNADRFGGKISGDFSETLFCLGDFSKLGPACRAQDMGIGKGPKSPTKQRSAAQVPLGIGIFPSDNFLSKTLSQAGTKRPKRQFWRHGPNPI